MNIEICTEKYTSELLSENQEKIFVFGDNMARKGKGGQAIIRGCPNAFGVATKRYPSMNEDAFFSDQPDEFDVVMNDLRQLYKLSKSHTVVFPVGGIGTGLAQMEKRSFAIWSKMCWILKDYFGYVNGG